LARRPPSFILFFFFLGNILVVHEISVTPALVGFNSPPGFFGIPRIFWRACILLNGSHRFVFSLSRRGDAVAMANNDTPFFWHDGEIFPPEMTKN
jgi:hypothetical protein